MKKLDADFEASLEKAAGEYDAKCAESRNVIEKAKADAENAEARISEAKAAIAKAEQDIADAEKVIADSKNAVSEHETLLTKLKADADADVEAKKAAHEKDTAALSDKLTKLSGDMEASKTEKNEELAKAEKDAAEFQDAIEKSEKLIADTNSAIEADRALVSEEEAKIGKIDSDAAAKKAEVEKAAKGRKVAFDDVINNKKEAKDKLRAGVKAAISARTAKRVANENKLKAELENKLKAIQELKENFVELAEKKAEENAKKRSAEIAEKEKEAEEVGKNIEKLAKAAEFAKAESIIAEKNVEDAKRAIEEAEKKLEEAKAMEIDLSQIDEEGGLPATAIYLKKYTQLSISEDDQIVDTFNDITIEPDKPKNIVVLGMHGFGSMCIGEDFGRTFYENGIIKAKTIAKIRAQALNKMNDKAKFEENMNKLAGGTLVIENGGLLLPEKLEKLVELSRPDKNDFVIIITGEVDSLTKLFDSCKSVNDDFTHLIQMHKITNEDMASIAVGYMDEKGYKMAETVLGKLSNILIAMELGNIDRLLKTIDVAMEKCDAREGASGTKLLLPDDFD